MVFTKFVEVGRVVYITYGINRGKTAVILDIINQNRVLIEGPTTGVQRQMIPIRRLSLTHFKLPIFKGSRTGVLRKSIKKYDLEKKWNDTTFAKKLANKAKKANLNDFERFRVMVLKKRLSKALAHGVKGLRKQQTTNKKPKTTKPTKATKATGKK